MIAYSQGVGENQTRVIEVKEKQVSGSLVERVEGVKASRLRQFKDLIAIEETGGTVLVGRITELGNIDIKQRI